jgi:hypothetical protein
MNILIKVYKMNEKEWVASFVEKLNRYFSKNHNGIEVHTSKKIAYAYEIQSYDGKKPYKYNPMAYETDVLITEITKYNSWIPRIVIEGKLKSVTTHDSITYSQKAQSHKNVHPYLRYGIILGSRAHYPLPGRLFRHGAHFDFMLSWKSYNPTKSEWNTFIKLLTNELEASRQLEDIIFNSRSRSRKRYTYLRKSLSLR